MSDMLIQVKDLCYRSGRCFLLYHLNWQVVLNEHWLVYGANGSGKTTLLSMIAGFKSPSSGTLSVLGEKYDEKIFFN